MQVYQFFLYVAFGVLPSLAWLFYYLRKDLHPEPKRMIIKIFIFGALITGPALLVQLGLLRLISQFSTWPTLSSFLTWFFAIALVEELFKYSIVRFAILQSPELDEPLDIMLYMVVAALGFAAAENVLYLFPPAGNPSFNAIIQATVTISFIRFIGATFLHTLCSALVGYFVALATLRARKRHLLAATGILLATFLHGLYDFSIITLHGPWAAFVPVLIIALLAVFMLYDFDEIKKVKSICKI